MADKLTEAHNRMAGDIVGQIVRGTIAAGGDDASIMVLLESICLGVLLTNEKHFRLKRTTSAEYMESLTQAVLTRLAGMKHDG